MNICVDIDGTLNNLQDVLYKVGEYFSKEILGLNTKMDKREYELRKSFGWNREQEELFWDTFMIHCFAMAEIREGAVEVLQRLKNEGHKIYLATARNKHINGVLEATKASLVYNNVPHDYLYMNVEDKAKFCKKYNIDVKIEDKLENCEAVSKVTRVFCFDNPYNQNYAGERIKKWIELPILKVEKTA